MATSVVVVGSVRQPKMGEFCPMQAPPISIIAASALYCCFCCTTRACVTPFLFALSFGCVVLAFRHFPTFSLLVANRYIYALQVLMTLFKQSRKRILYFNEK
jgi:hypothetical protein